MMVVVMVVKNTYGGAPKNGDGGGYGDGEPW
jgi:hypothetical protein